MDHCGVGNRSTERFVRLCDGIRAGGTQRSNEESARRKDTGKQPTGPAESRRRAWQQLAATGREEGHGDGWPAGSPNHPRAADNSITASSRLAKRAWYFDCVCVSVSVCPSGDCRAIVGFLFSGDFRDTSGTPVGRNHMSINDY